MRNNSVRKSRACIRPEISRTGMTPEGKKGASRGLFFTQHLAKIVVNDVFTNFTKLDLSYLFKESYDNAFLENVYSAPVISLKELPWKFQSLDSKAMRIQYKTLKEYLQIAKYLKIMRDFKEGVSRTAYFGVVTCFFYGKRIYVAPDRDTWQGYDPKWEASQTDMEIN
ncbi:unnamed protein product [Thelazia callipaeda]|uniref:Alpha-1,3-mannosyl-glycoprotein 2-beta-N-acetylglucosaminyltransferase n=1 Tax=Thelazia callipaeda TaxID=103827 RepID=A0A0N5CSD8_THECL|nr:unnamed protein product [Thelazia callipaeda]